MEGDIVVGLADKLGVILLTEANLGAELEVYNSASDAFALSGTQRYELPVENPPVFEAIDRIPTASWRTSIGTMSDQRNAIAQMKQRGGNALGIDREGLRFIFLVSTAWSDAVDDDAVNGMTDNTVRRVEEAAQAAGVANRYLYINYASAEQGDRVFAGYGEENVERLKAIQRAVDPRGIFTSKGLWRGFIKLM
ncbi:hypothetical protein BDW59DRAFT_160879 [Aspergillus cavernicola]|uniref:Berberine/berberine-like domain-containing protein n=1 Tax=Aspergillus cavernicola TaxID=176166 RepID=A0ABR4IG22_9EURO